MALIVQKFGGTSVGSVERIQAVADKVKRFRDNGDDIFVHFRSIRGDGHRVLRDGQRVEFAVCEGEKGLQAEDVAVAN